MAQSPDEITDVIAMAALPLPAALRSAFTVQVLTRLRACPAESVGVGLAHRIAAEEQRNFLKAAPNTVGPDEARATRAGVARSGRRLARASLPQCRGPLQDHDPHAARRRRLPRASPCPYRTRHLATVLRGQRNIAGAGAMPAIMKRAASGRLLTLSSHNHAMIYGGG